MCYIGIRYKVLELIGGENMESEVYKTVIENLRAAIEKSGMKQKAVAEKANMTPRKLSDVLCLRKRLDVADIPVFCKILGIEPAKIFEGAA